MSGVFGFCPPSSRATPLLGVFSLLAGGWVEEGACATHPPASRAIEVTSVINCLAGGRRELVYQIYTPSTSIDTLVTGMPLSTANESS